VHPVVYWVEHQREAVKRFGIDQYIGKAEGPKAKPPRAIAASESAEAKMKRCEGNLLGSSGSGVLVNGKRAFLWRGALLSID